MDYRLNGGDFTIQNVRRVVDKSGEVVGEMHIHRRSGWRGGPSYQFTPNDSGTARGLTVVSGTKLREVLGKLG